jgi:ubiquinone biosynthesis protein
MLPLEYSREFLKLTDSVVPFPFLEAKKIIEEDLKAPLNETFSVFDEVPVAAASIAQVHRATLHDGREVMVKVQRPHITRIIERDISIMRWLADLIETRVPEMALHNIRGLDEFCAPQKRGTGFIEVPCHQLGTIFSAARFIFRGVYRFEQTRPRYGNG